MRCQIRSCAGPGSWRERDRCQSRLRSLMHGSGPEREGRVGLSPSHGVSMTFKIAYSALLAALVVSVFMGWRWAVSEKLPDLSAWRRRLPLLGLVGNLASLILFLAAVFQPALVSKTA